MRNPVARNNKHRGGSFKEKDRAGRSYIKKKIQKDLEELDERWIREEINERDNEGDG